MKTTANNNEVINKIDEEVINGIEYVAVYDAEDITEGAVREDEKKAEKKANRKELGFFEIVKETPKAICVKLSVSWNSNYYTKDIWFPRSVANFDTFTTPQGKEVTHLMVDEWFLNEQEKKNAYHNYMMRFDVLN